MECFCSIHRSVIWASSDKALACFAGGRPQIPGRRTRRHRHMTRRGIKIDHLHLTLPPSRANSSCFRHVQLMCASRSSERLRDKRPAQQTKRSAQTPCDQESSSAQSSTAFQDQSKSGIRRRVRYEAGESSSAAHSRLYSRVKGRRGKLEFMHKVPLDVIYEIFGLLEPLDLLHISWASKSLNAIVTSRQAKFLWKRVCASAV